METSAPLLKPDYARHFRETIRLSVPVIIGQVGHVMMGVIDNMMIGDIGYEYISAASLANGLFFLVTVLGMGISMILSPLVAEADAAGKSRLVGRYLQQGIFISLLLSAFLGILVYFSAELMPYMDQPQRDVELAFSYLHILAWTTPMFLLFLAGKSFSDGLSLTRPAMYITLIGLGINVFANWLLIYGNWGLPRLELDGAGYATLFSRFSMAVLIFVYIFSTPRFKKYLFPWEGIDKHISVKLLRLGIPSGMQFFFEVGAFVGASFMIGWIGSAERSAHQIVISLCSTSFMVVVGIAAGSTIRVGDALGRQDWVNVRKAGLAGVILGASFMAVSAITFVLLRNFLPALFLETDPLLAAEGNEMVLSLAAHLMVLAAFFQVFDGAQAVGAGILRGIQDVRVPTIITFLVYWVLTLPLAYFLGFTLGMGLTGIWYALILSLVIAAIWLIWRFVKMTHNREPSSDEKESTAQVPPLTPTALTSSPHTSE